MKSVHAAVGIVCRRDGAVFLQQRAPHNPYYPNYWEFPGGKVEAGETPAAALRRELREEIGIEVTAFRPWLCRRHAYPHALVTLSFFRVQQWRGEPQGKEGQQWQWHQVTSAPPPLLPASEVPWRWLRLPPRCVVSAAEVVGVQRTLDLLPQVAAQPVLLQLRDKNLPSAQRLQLAQAMAPAVAAGGGLLMVNDDEALARKVHANLHLSSARLRACTTRPPFDWVGASCHTAEELAQAAALQLDYAVLSPVCKTLTHVQAVPLGWEGFAAHAAATPLPLYALGGLAEQDLPTAQMHGAHGIAMMRQGWQPA